MRERLRDLTMALMRLPGLSGHEGPVRRRLKQELDALGLAHRTDRLGNLIATLPGAAAAPSVMVIAHMDQIGFVIRRLEPDGLARLERVGGAPERALPGQAVMIGDDLRRGVIGSTSHHLSAPEDRRRTPPYTDLVVDCGFRSAAEAEAHGVTVGAPVVYLPQALALGPDRIAGVAIDDRAGCAVLVQALSALRAAPARPTVHAVFSVQEEFNLRGAVPAAQALKPDICLQLDLALATDTPDLAGRGAVALGEGPAMSLFSFHGRGTLNGLLPHPALVALISRAAAEAGLPLQRATQMGALTETSYVQLVGEGVACVDLGFPCRYAHSPAEVCDLGDLEGLARLLIAAIPAITPEFSLDPDAAPARPAQRTEP